jgi:TusA-related sulfurtransferase
MSENPERITVDVRGEICPDPLIKALAAIRSAKTGQVILLITDFWPAVLAVTNAAGKEGWDIQIQRTDAKQWSLTLTKSTEGLTAGT